MCNNIILLAEHDEHRLVCICEHGTIHFSWDHLTLYLRGEDYLSLDHCLDRALLNHKYGQMDMEDEMAMNAPSCLLWVFDIALKLSFADLIIMAELVYQGSQCLPSTIPRHQNEEIKVADWPFSHTIHFKDRYTLN